MSDMRKIIEARKTTRDQSTVEMRQIQALEDIADALEGIRQDLMVLPTSLAATLQSALPK